MRLVCLSVLPTNALAVRGVGLARIPRSYACLLLAGGPLATALPCDSQIAAWRHGCTDLVPHVGLQQQ